MTKYEQRWRHYLSHVCKQSTTTIVLNKARLSPSQFYILQKMLLLLIFIKLYTITSASFTLFPYSIPHWLHY